MNATSTITTTSINTIPSSPSFQMDSVAQAQVQAQAGGSSSSSEDTSSANACTNGQKFAASTSGKSIHPEPQEPTRRIELNVCLTSSSSTCTIEEHNRQQEASFSFANQHSMMTNHHRPPHTVVSGSSSSTATNRSIPSSGVDAAALDKIVELQTSMFRRALPITTDLQNQHRRKPVKSVVHSHYSTTTASLQRSNKPQLKPLHSSSSLSSIGSTTVSTSTMSSKKSKLKRFLAFKPSHNKATSSNIGSTVGTGASYSSCCNQSHSSSNHSCKRSMNKDGESVSCTSSSKVKSIPVLPAFCLDGAGGGGSLSSSSKPRSYHCATTSDLITIMIQSKNESSSGGDSSTSRPPSKIWQPGEDNGPPPPRRSSANHTLRLIQLCKRHPSVNDVISLLKKYPEALKGRNTLGQTPLHVATSVAVSAEVILYILEQDYEAASIQDSCGRYPIHYAARQSNWRSAHAGLFLMMDDDDHDYFYGGGHDEDRPDHGMFDDGTTTFAPAPTPRLEEETDQRHQDVFDYDSDCSTEDDDCDDEEEEKKDDSTTSDGVAACPKSSTRGGGFLDVSGRNGGGGVVNYNKSSKHSSKHKYVDHLLDPMYKCMIKTLAKACPKALNHEDHDGINAIEYAVLDENASMDVIKLMQRTCIRELRRLHSSSRVQQEDLKKTTTVESHQAPTIIPTSPRSTLTFSARNEVAGRSA